MSARRLPVFLPPPPLHFLGYSRVPLQILGSFVLQPYHPLLFYSPGLNLSKAFLLEQVPSGKNSTWVKKKQTIKRPE